jgi:hypothetical protein
VGFSCAIYIFVVIICLKARNQAEDDVARAGLSLLFYAGICMILFLIMLIIENILITVFDHPGFSEFFYVGWVFAGIFVVLAYLSLIMPDWLVKRIKGDKK